MKLDLSGHTALVTGSVRNTGEVIARSLADAGAALVLHSNADDGSAEAAAAQMPGAHWVCGSIQPYVVQRVVAASRSSTLGI